MILYAAEPPKPPDAADSDPDIELAERMERAFRKLAARVAPCVVSLKVHVVPGNWMEELRRMGEQFNTYPPDRQFEGSGVIIDPAGYIATNEHVVHGADRITVALSDGRVFGATVTGTDPRSDLAMIKLAGNDVPKDLPCAVLADSDKVAVGQYALAIGNPFGLANSVTLGVVSARGRSVPVHNLSGDVFYGNLIQTDATINPGNSGGPLFDLHGKLMGINTMIFSKTGISQACGFAIPANHLRKRIELLKAGREIEYGWLGVRLSDLLPGQKEYNVSDNRGVLVDGVIANTPADRAGLEQGMVITDYDGARISGSQDLMSAVNDTPIGRSVKVKVVDRAGTPAEFTIRVSKRYSEVVTMIRDEGDDATAAAEFDEDALIEGGAKPVAEKTAKPGAAQYTGKAFAWRGLMVKELTAEDGRKRGGRIEIVRVKRGTAADRAGLYEGAIITELKHGGEPAIQKIASLEDFKRVTGNVKGAASLYIAPDGYVTIEEK
jgi:serine protease Do